ncbi:hypothetical protein NC997_24375 [Trichocoleus sp. DQ-A2]|uniref:hypothetical protein n=1 Tax=Cyanophyceae TaxID=3028117 RepID=UPI0016867179|nr:MULTISPECIES: hypothetical protein [unclassified Coleofasciculus]MBD1880930.1 hypothetical protein [Coleofasciculus sp. FACHB-T130]MBD1892435.1 hypothetical protein [Coleofasciculus sp. FACHB-SPT9]
MLIDQELKTWLIYASELKFCAAYTACGIGGTDLRGGGVEGCDRAIASCCKALAKPSEKRSAKLIYSGSHS